MAVVNINTDWTIDGTLTLTPSGSTATILATNDLIDIVSGNGSFASSTSLRIDDGAGEVTVSQGAFIVPDGSLYSGVNDSTQGMLHLYGAATTNGGETRFYAAADSDTTVDYWRARVAGTTFIINGSTSSTGNLQLTSTLAHLNSPDGSKGVQVTNTDVSINGTIVANTVVNEGITSTKILTLDSSDNIDFRTPAEILSDIGAQAAADYLRADVADSKTSGDLTFNDDVSIRYGTDTDALIYYNNSGNDIRFSLQSVDDYRIEDNGTTRFRFNRTSGDLFLASGDLNLIDGGQVRLGNSQDSEIYFGGSNTFWDLNVGNLLIRDATTEIFRFERANRRFSIGDTGPDYTFVANSQAADASGENIVAQFAGGDSLSTTGDSTVIYMANRGSTNLYGAKISLENTATSPSFLNPQLDFKLQDNNTSAIGSVTTKLRLKGTGQVQLPDGYGTNTHTGTVAYWIGVDSSGNLIEAASGMDADTLDTLDSTQFLRSDVSDVKTSGDLRFDDAIAINWGTDVDAEQYYNNSTAQLRFNLITGGSIHFQDNDTTRTSWSRSSGQWSMASDINAAYATTNLAEFEDANDTLIVKNVNNAISNGYTSIYMEHLGSGGRGTGRFNMINLAAGKSAFTWQLRDDAHTTDMREKMRLEGDGNLDLIDGNLVVADGYGLQSSSLAAVGVFIPASDGIDITAFDDTVFYNWGGSSYDEILRLDASARVGIMTGNFRPDVDSTRNLGSSSIRWSSVYADVFRSLTNVATSKTDGAAVFDGTTGAIVLDDQGQKRISWNDGGGNFTIRAGNYFNTADERVVVAGDGAALIAMNTDGANGYIDLKVGVTQASADDPVVWATNGHVFRAQTDGISFFGTSFEGTASVMVHEVTGRNGLYVNVPDGNGTSLRVGRADASSWWNVNHAGNDFRLWNSGGSGQDVLIGVDSSGADQSNNLSVRTTSATYHLNVGGDIWYPNAEYLYSELAAGTDTRIHGINASDIEYIGSIDAAVAGTIIGNNTPSIQFNLNNLNNARLFTSGTQTTFDIGSADNQQGVIVLNGVGAGEGTNGGQIWMRLAADHDTTIDRFQIVTSADDFLIGHNNDTDIIFRYEGGNDEITIGLGASNVGINKDNPESRFHIQETVDLGGVAGNVLPLTTVQTAGGSGGNEVYMRTWAVRNATGTDWTTWSHHDAISIDSSYGTPGTDTRAFWERDPQTGSHYFGDQADTILTIDGANNRIGVGITSPDHPIHGVQTGAGLQKVLKLENTTDGVGSAVGMVFAAVASGNEKGGIFFENDGTGSGQGTIHFCQESTNDNTQVTLSHSVIQIDTNGHLKPATDGTHDLGTTSLRWRDIFADDLEARRVGIGIAVGADPELHVYANDSATAHGLVRVEQAGSGDAGIEIKAGGSTWTLGVDNSDGDNLKISTTLGVGSGVQLEIDRTTGAMTAIDGTRKIVTDDATTTHTVTASDHAVVRRFTSSSAITVTVDTGSLTNIGETAEIDQYGTGLVTIAAGTATLRVNGNATLVSSGQYSRISIQKMTSTEYRVFGELEPA